MQPTGARAAHRYAARYCEENVWHLAQHADLAPGPRHVVFISGRRGAFAMWAQRAAEHPRAPMIWDYHVVLAAGRAIYDLDGTLDFPVDVEAWLDASFPNPGRLNPIVLPLFRIVPAEEYVRTFASDRSHRREHPDVPPPPWPCIRTAEATMNLGTFADVLGPGPGTRADLAGVRAFFTGNFESLAPAKRS